MKFLSITQRIIIAIIFFGIGYNIGVNGFEFYSCYVNQGCISIHLISDILFELVLAFWIAIYLNLYGHWRQALVDLDDIRTKLLSLLFTILNKR